MTVDHVLDRRLVEAVQTATDPDALQQDLDRFLPNASIAVSDKVETARISKAGDRYRIEFGRAFLERELRAPADLLFVFLHECFHHVLGHLDGPRRPRGPLRRLADNIAADILVNRAVCERFFPKGVGLLRRLYSDADPVAVLLRPPPREQPGRARAWRRFRLRLREAGFGDAVARRAWGIRCAAWDGDVPFPRLAQEVLDLLKRLGVRPCLVFLGDHSRRSPVPGLPWDAEDGGQGAGFGDEVEENELPEVVVPERSIPVALAVRAALDRDPNSPRSTPARTPVSSPCFGPGRRDYPFLALGFWPTLYHGPRHDRSDEDLRARVYVDVSGSFRRVQARVFGFLLALADEVGPSVFQFSNQVEEVSIRDIARGIRRTTHGTDFDCVVRHALEHRFRRIVVLTDGFGDLEDANAEAFRASGASLYLVLIDQDPVLGRQGPLADLARQVWELD